MTETSDAPTTMQAVQVQELVGIQGIHVSQVPVPEVSAHEVLIDVKNVGLSSADLLMAAGQYQAIPELPFTIGMDLAGTVTGVGDAVSSFRIGDRVAATMPHGAAARFAAVSESSVFSLPDSVSFKEGAALPTNYLTAYFALVVRGSLKPGETVLVHGAAGGVGSAAVQMAQALGARAIAVASSAAKAEFARAHGAQDVVLVDGFKQSVLEITDGKGVDMVIDTVGASVIDDSLRCLRFGGRHLVLGFAGGEVPMVKANRLLLRNIDVRGVGWGGHLEAEAEKTAEQWAQMKPLLEAGKLRPAIGATRPLVEIADALTDLKERRAMGKIVLEV